ncbi:MAG: energy transducer TonB [Bacteroidetes bacterium]|nr:energy transducer TonB [Bacteroidota bacterium]
MSEKLKHTLYTPTDCISEQTMFDYIDHALSPKQQHVVEKHLLECELCSDAMDGLRLVKNRNIIGTINQQVAEKMAMPPVVKKSGGFNYKIVMSVAAGLLLLMGGLFFFNHLAPPSAEEKATVADLKTDQKAKEIQNETTPGTGKPATPSGTVTTKNKAVDRSEANDQSPAPVLKEEEAKQERPAQETAPDELRKAENTEKTETTVALEGAAANAKLTDSISVADKGTGTYTYEWNTPKTDKDDGNSAGAGALAPQKEEDKNQAATYAVVTEQLADEAKDQKAEKMKAKKAPEEKKANAVAGDYKATPSTSETPAYAPPDLAQNYNKVIKGDSISTISGLSNNSITAFVDQTPEFPGGNAALLKFISSNAKWPVQAAGKEITATKIYVQFTIDKYGNVKNPKILKGINDGYDKEALRVVSLMPKWKPAISGGKTTAYVYSMQILTDQKLNAK